MSRGTGQPLRRRAGTRAVIAAASLGVSLAIGVAAAQTAPKKVDDSISAEQKRLQQTEKQLREE